MQILYGNDGVNYRLINKSNDMSSGIQKSMLSTYSKYEYVSHPRRYSSIDKEPETITYVTSNLDNQMSTEKVIVCKAGHMSQYSSPSYYFHGIIADVTNDFYKSEFFEIFNYRFIRDVDVSKYEEENIDDYSYVGENQKMSELTDEQLVVILASFMANEKKGQKTKILVDATGDQYNFRSREILKSIYKYLPYELRRRYGFKTYSQDDRNIPARVSFVLFNADETEDNGSFITLKECVADIGNIIDAQYVSYAKHLVEELDEVGREKHFAILSRFAKNGRLSINECLTYYNNMNKWTSGTQEELLPEWIQYIEQNSFRKGPLYELLLELIVQRVENSYYNDYLFNNILKLYKENIYNLSPLAAKTIRFADCLEEIYIEPERFSQWYRGTLKEKIDSLHIDRLDKFYEEEIEELKAVDIMSDELTILLQTEIDYLAEMRDMVSGDIEQQKMQELEDAGRKIGALEYCSLEEFVSQVKQIWLKIRFQENRQDLVFTIEEWLDNHLQIDFISENEWLEYYQLFTQMKELISFDKYYEVDKKLQTVLAKIREEQKAKEVIISKETMLESYVVLTNALENRRIDMQDKIKAEIDGKKIKASPRIIKRLLEFILCPNQDNVETIMKNPDLITYILATNMFTVEHAEYLFACKLLDETIVTDIIKYYLEEPSKIKASGIYLANLVYENHSHACEELINEYEDEAGELGIFADELKKLAHNASKRSKMVWMLDDEDEEKEKPAPEKKRGFGFFGGKK